MTSMELKARVDAFTSEARELENKRVALVADLAKVITDRLLELYEGRDIEELRNLTTFEGWLSSRFEYDIYFVYNIFDKDPELIELKGYIDGIGMRDLNRLEAADAVNAHLREGGYKLGVNNRLNDIQRI